jgi:5-methylcytosine-specific restriction protein B
MTVFVLRGAKSASQRTPESTVGEYLSGDCKKAIRSAITDTRPEESLTQLQSLLESELVSAWGIKSSRSKKIGNLNTISAGDHILFSISETSQKDNSIRYIQRVDLTLGFEVSEDTRSAIADAIWNDTGYEYIWFSERPITEINLPESALDTMLQSVDPNFSIQELFPRTGVNFKPLPDPIYAAYETDQAIIEALAEKSNTVHWRDGDDRRTYPSVGSAYADIKTRLEEAGQEEWLMRQPADAIIRGWTDALEEVQPGATLSWQAAAHIRQLIGLYEEYRPRLADLAATIGAGKIEDLTPAETLFIALIRDIQNRASQQQNFDPEKFRVLQNEEYSIKFPDEAERRQPTEPSPRISPPNKPENADRIARQLQKTNQVVFYGPPGTSKTYTAQRFARWWAANQQRITARENQVRTVTFHPSFSYEDFVEGLTAEATDDGTVTYRIKKGILRRICDDALEAYIESGENEAVPRYVLIIDEINRGNLSQIFGEMITLLESDKRLDAPNETRVDLAHSGDELVLPPNLYLIGTMNTADRSIGLIDAAIRRRFRFLSFSPDYELLYEHHGFGGQKQQALEAVRADTDIETALRVLSILALKELNSRIISAPDLEKGNQIGHTYLLDLDDEQEITEAWKYEILPLIEEFYYSQFNRIRDDLFAGEGHKLVDWTAEEIRDFSPEELTGELLQVLDRQTSQALQQQLQVEDKND